MEDHLVNQHLQFKVIATSLTFNPCNSVLSVLRLLLGGLSFRILLNGVLVHAGVSRQ